MSALTLLVAALLIGSSYAPGPETPDPSANQASGEVRVERGNGSGDGAFDQVTLIATEAQDAIRTANEGADNSHPPIESDSSQPGPTGSSTDSSRGLDTDYCGWASLATPPDASDPAWKGNSPSDGEIRWKSCAILGPGTPGAPGNIEGRPVEYQFFPNAALAAAAPPPPDPQVIAQRAIRQLQVPAPAIGAGPDRTKLAVNLWTWLWIDNPGPLTATAAAGGVSVTATATLESVTWSLGEPAATGGTYAPGPPVTITCQGTGIAPPPDYDWKAEPPCGHKYTWMSTTDRTGGTGKWPITATTNWTVTWQSNTGVSGATTLTATGTDALEIGEYRVVLVQGAGG